jgi:hypothetical protein
MDVDMILMHKVLDSTLIDKTTRGSTIHVHSDDKTPRGATIYVCSDDQICRPLRCI